MVVNILRMFDTDLDEVNDSEIIKKIHKLNLGETNESK